MPRGAVGQALSSGFTADELAPHKAAASLIERLGLNL
jgi:hypothetical protein